MDDKIKHWENRTIYFGVERQGVFVGFVKGANKKHCLKKAKSFFSDCKLVGQGFRK